MKLLKLFFYFSFIFLPLATLILIPNTETLTEKDTVKVSSHDIEEFINSKTVFVSVDDLPDITDKVAEKNDQNSTDNKTNQ